METGEQYKGFRIAVLESYYAEGNGPRQFGFTCVVYDASGQRVCSFKGPSSSTLFNSPDEAVQYAKAEIDAGKLETKVMTNTPHTHSILYHYCRVSGFYGILSSGKIWLSDAYFMNDYMEHKWIVDKAIQHLETVGKEPANARFCDKLKHSLLTALVHPYVGCFSSEPDLLSQWRAYSDDGAGFAIGFSYDGIDDRWTRTINKGVVFGRVEYELRKQEELLVGTIEDCLRRYLKLPQQGTASGGEGLVDANTRGWDDEGLTIADAHARVWNLAAFCKNYGFREESEYRIVRMPFPQYASEMCFRVSGTQLVPYFEFDFRPEDVVEIRLGPRNRKPEVRQSIEMFMRHKHYDLDPNRIIPSDITYDGA